MSNKLLPHYLAVILIHVAAAALDYQKTLIPTTREEIQLCHGNFKIMSEMSWPAFPFVGLQAKPIHHGGPALFWPPNIMKQTFSSNTSHLQYVC
jgi:hypothetical protein